MKRFLLVISAVILSVALKAQSVTVFSSDAFQSRSFSVTGHVADSTTNESLSFVSAYLRHSSDTLITNFALSDVEGNINLPDVTVGNYVLTVEYLGYKKYQKEFYVRKNVELGEIRLQQDVRALNAASVSAAGKEVEFRQDTIIFNAGLFKTGSNDNLAALLKRMPGVEISESGTVTVNGKAVDKITIEGKTFFMNDNTAALNNLPASIVDKIKVIDKDSDEAQISGIGDIEKQRVMDVELKEEYKKGFFGNVKVGGGVPVPGKRDDEFLETDRAVFNSSLLASYYDEKDQLTVIGNAQNVNDSNSMVYVVTYDNLGEGSTSLPGGGVHTSWSGGANLNTERIKNVSTSISAKYSDEKVDYHSFSDRLTYQSAVSDLQDKVETFTDGNSRTASVNAELKNLNSKKMSFIFRPSLKYNHISQDSKVTSDSFYGGSLENSSLSFTGSDERSITASGSLQASAKFSSTDKRRIGLIASYNLTDGDGEAYDDRTVDYASSGIEHQALTYDKTTKSSGLSAGITYTEPLAEKLTLHLETLSTFSDTKRDRLAYGEAGLKNDAFSSCSQTEYTNHNLRLRGQYSNGTSTFNIGADAYLSENYVRATSAGISTETGKDDWLFNVSPYLVFNSNKMQDGKTLYYMINVTGRVERPSTTSAMPSLSILSPTRLSVGNIYLRPHSNQMVYMYVNASNQKSQSLSLYLNSNMDFNGSTSAIWYDSNSIMYTVPVNVKDPSLNISGNISLGSPLTRDGKLRINIDALVSSDSRTSYQSSGIRDGFDLEGFKYYDFMSSFWGNDDGDLFFSGKSGFQKSRTTSLRSALDMTLRLNLDNLQLRASLSPAMRRARYSLDSRADLNTFDMSYGLDATYTTKHGFELQTILDYSTFKGYRDTFNDPLCDWRFSVLKNVKAFTFGVSVLDILNQARTKTPTWTDNYSEYRYTNTIGRCILASVKFNFGKMNSAKASSAQQASFRMML